MLDSVPLLLHETEQIAIRVADEADPELMVGHLDGKLRFALVLRSAGKDRGMGGGDVGDLEIEDRVLAGGSRALRNAQHDADAAGCEECERRGRTEEKPRPRTSR